MQKQRQWMEEGRKRQEKSLRDQMKWTQEQQQRFMRERQMREWQAQHGDEVKSPGCFWRVVRVVLTLIVIALAQLVFYIVLQAIL
jgi:hypothetical protein